MQAQHVAIVGRIFLPRATPFDPAAPSVNIHSSTIVLLTALALPIACKRGDAPGGGEASVKPASSATDSESGAGKLAKTKKGPKLVRVEALEPTAVEERLPCTSHVEAYHSVLIKSQVQAQVLEVRVREGQSVRKGELLFALDKRQATLNLASAKNTKQSADDSKREAQLQVDDARNRIAQAEIDLQQATRALERRKASAKNELSSPAQLEDAQLEFDKAKNALDLANNQLKVAEHGLIKAKTTLESSVIQVQLQERLLEDYEIRAPIDGVIPELTIRGGEWLSPQMDLCTIVANKRLILQLKRPQKELGRLEIGQRVDIECDAYPGETFVGEIDLLAPTIDMDTGTFRARVSIHDSTEVKLRPGMFVRAWIVTGTNQAALMIPKQAIIYDAQQPCAYVVRDGKAARIKIDRGIDLKDAVEARNVADVAQAGSFTRGDSIIVVGVDGLTDGGDVEVQAAPSADTGAQAGAAAGPDAAAKTGTRKQ